MKNMQEILWPATRARKIAKPGVQAVPLGHKPPAGAVAIPLTRGCTCWVDEADLPLVTLYNWYANISSSGRVYAYTATKPDPLEHRRCRIIPMHRLLLDAVDGREIDHRRQPSEAVVDNRRCNLRVAGHDENMRNRVKNRSLTSSRFKGVCWDRFTGNWKASVWTGGKGRSLGRFESEIDAARAYDDAAVLAFGEFAMTNFPTTGSVNWIFNEPAQGGA